MLTLIESSWNFILNQRYTNCFHFAFGRQFHFCHISVVGGSSSRTTYPVTDLASQHGTCHSRIRNLHMTWLPRIRQQHMLCIQVTPACCLLNLSSLFIFYHTWKFGFALTTMLICTRLPILLPFNEVLMIKYICQAYPLLENFTSRHCCHSQFHSAHFQRERERGILVFH